MRLFFCAAGEFNPSLLNHLLHVLLAKCLEVVIAVDGFLESGNLVARNVARDVFTIFPSLMVVEGAVCTLSGYANLAPLQLLDLGHFLKKRLRRSLFIHERSM